MRWFTPQVEVDLCGHGTLAAAHVLWQTGRWPKVSAHPLRDPQRRAGLARREGVDLARFSAHCPGAAHSGSLPMGRLSRLPAAAGKPWRPGPSSCLSSAAFRRRSARSPPDFSTPCGRCRAGDHGDGAIEPGPGWRTTSSPATSPPGSRVDEDPVTGSNHCALVPFWAERLGKSQREALVRLAHLARGVLQQTTVAITL